MTVKISMAFRHCFLRQAQESSNKNPLATLKPPSANLWSMLKRRGKDRHKMHV